MPSLRTPATTHSCDKVNDCAILIERARAETPVPLIPTLPVPDAFALMAPHYHAVLVRIKRWFCRSSPAA